MSECTGWWWGDKPTVLGRGQRSVAGFTWGADKEARRRSRVDVSVDSAVIVDGASRPGCVPMALACGGAFGRRSRSWDGPLGRGEGRCDLRRARTRAGLYLR